MSKIITVSDINSTKFYQLPKAFFHNPVYMAMQNESKLAYSILRDLLELSIKHAWINENNEVYVKLSRGKLMQYLNIKGKQKITQVMDELKSKELIVEKQLGLKQCNEIYICIPNELETIYSDKELLEIENQTSVTVENTLKFENQTSRGLIFKPLEVRKSNLLEFENQTHTKTNSTKTNITKDDDDSKQSIIDLYLDNFKETSTTKKNLDNLLTTYEPTLISEILNKMLEFNKENKITYPMKYLKKSLNEEVKPKNVKKKTSVKKQKELKDLKFNNFEPREYDYDDLEKKLLGWDK